MGIGSNLCTLGFCIIMSRPLQHGYLDRSLYTHRIFADKPLFAPSVISLDGYVQLYRNQLLRLVKDIGHQSNLHLLLSDSYLV